MQSGPFLRDERGSMTIEFMIWIPLLMLWFVGSVVIYDAYRNRDDAAKAAYTISDIVSREIEIAATTPNEIDDLFTLQTRMLPYADGETALRISSIKYIAKNDRHCLAWSEARGDVARYPALTQQDVLTDAFAARVPQMADQDHILLVEVMVPFVPFATLVGIEVQTWRFDLFTRPRFVSKVAMAGVASPCDS